MHNIPSFHGDNAFVDAQDTEGPSFCMTMAYRPPKMIETPVSAEEKNRCCERAPAKRKSSMQDAIYCQYFDF